MALIETADLLGDRLDLRIAADFHRISNARYVLRWMDDWEMSMGEVENLIRYFMKGYDAMNPEQMPYILGIWLKSTGGFIGICGFGPKEELGGEAEIAYFMDEAYAGKGYMSQFVKEAIHFYFEMTGKPYLSALVDERNLPSKRILEKMGFEYQDTADPQGSIRPHYRLYRDRYLK